MTGIFAGAPQEIEGNEARFPAAEQQVVELGSALVLQADDLLENNVSADCQYFSP